MDMSVPPCPIDGGAGDTIEDIHEGHDPSVAHDAKCACCNN